MTLSFVIDCGSIGALSSACNGNVVGHASCVFMNVRSSASAGLKSLVIGSERWPAFSSRARSLGSGMRPFAGS